MYDRLLRKNIDVSKAKWNAVASAEEDRRSHATSGGGGSLRSKTAIGGRGEKKIRKMNIIKWKRRHFGLDIVLGPFKAVKD